MKWFGNFNVYGLIVTVIVLMIVTRLVAPDTAQWVMSPIVELTRAAIQALRDFGG